MQEAEKITISTSKLRRLCDNEEIAEIASLKYVSDCAPGITRISKGGKFIYLFNDEEVKEPGTLSRIQKLVIPPAWENVWICQFPDGHLQATGLDTLHRKQYRYHALWNALRSQTKYSHLYDFGLALPSIKQHIQKDLALPGLPLDKVLATIVFLMQQTCIRIGNGEYEKLYGSFGLTTLKDKHVKIAGNELRFAFKGKKGVYHNITLKSKRLARIVKQCRDIPGQELFQYYDDNRNRHSVDSGMVNDYIKSICKEHFTSKDFRTWAGTVHALETFYEFGCSDTEKETKNKIVDALDIVAKHLGNTRTVCRKYYVHPAVIDHYANKTIEKYFHQIEQLKSNNTNADLSAGEQVLMKMLKDVKSIVIEI